MRQSHERESERGADDAHEQDRTAPEAIGKPSENRGEDDLHPGINSGQPTDSDRRSVKVLRVQRQDRNDDAEPDQVDEDREEEDEERRTRTRHWGEVTSGT